MKLGVHLVPHGYPAWAKPENDPQRWISLMLQMGIGTAVVCSDGCGALPYTHVDEDTGTVTRMFDGTSAVERLLAVGIKPLLRFTPTNLPRPFSAMVHVETFVMCCNKYAVEAGIIAGNEPGDEREWHKGSVPRDWMWQFASWWRNAARIIVERGGVAYFPDGPCYPQNPFPMLAGTEWMWLGGKAKYAAHNYGLNRPPHYPTDDVSVNGTPLTEDEHKQLLGPMYNVPGWREPLDAINRQRAELASANPGRKSLSNIAFFKKPQSSSPISALDDDTCWRGWEKIDYWARQYFGQPVTIVVTEGGWTPGAVASGFDDKYQPFTDIRWPKPTPDVVAKWTLEALEDPDQRVDTACFWLLADKLMCAGGLWEGDTWVGGWGTEHGYGIEKPVVAALRNRCQKGAPACMDTALVRMRKADSYIDQAIAALK